MRKGRPFPTGIWREVSQIGEEFFDLLEKPFKKPAFVEFVNNAEVTSGIAEIPPLEARFSLIKGSPATRGFYEKVLAAIKKETSDGLPGLYGRLCARSCRSSPACSWS
jgi:hypothetical protein